MMILTRRCYWCNDVIPEGGIINNNKVFCDINCKNAWDKIFEEINIERKQHELKPII